MMRLFQPHMYRLLRNGSRDEYHLADRAEEIAWELHKVLSVFEPCGDDERMLLLYKRVCRHYWEVYPEISEKSDEDKGTDLLQMIKAFAAEDYKVSN